TTGAQNDIEQATKVARAMVTTFGMSDKLGPRTFGHKDEMVFLGREISEQRDYSDKIAEQIDDEVHSIIQQAHQTASKILADNKDKLIRIAQELITKETLEGDELDKLFTKRPASPRPPKAPTTRAPAPAKTVTEIKPVTEKPAAKARPFPRQAPAPSD
ncbi:cell division protein FtsH, partial [Chloroflexota bacterium]